MMFSEERGVPSTGMCGFNQSERIFLVWILVVSKNISVYFYGILIENLCPIGIKAPFYILSFPITNMFFFGHVVVSNQTKIYLLRT